MQELNQTPNPGDYISKGEEQQTPDQLDRTFADFEKNLEKLSARFHSPKTTIIKSLIENTCEYRTRHEIEFPNYSSVQKFDSYFSLKHEFEKNRFVQRLTLSLRERGFQAAVSTEQKHIVGVFDVLISNAKFLVTISDKSGKKIVVEWKAGASVSLSQIERYLWEADVVILVRVQMKQVVRIARIDVELYLKKSLTTLNERALLIASTSIKDTLQKIPGQYCKGCPATDCQFYRPGPKEDKIICFGSESMTKDLLSVFNNVEDCIDEAVRIVITELTNVGVRT